MKIFVTDGNNRATLAITRSLGKLGHQIYVGEKSNLSLAARSKYCFKAISYPDPKTQCDNFISSLLAATREHKIELIIPVADITTLQIAENRSTFEPHCLLPFPDITTLKNTADKDYIAKLALELGVPIPHTHTISNKADIFNLPESLQFPVVVKPSRSRVKTTNGWIFTSVSYANSKLDLMRDLEAKNSAEYPILIQERITGPGEGVFLCYDRGAMLAYFSHRRLREKPPSGGVSVLRESIPTDPKLLDLSKKLLDALQWHGVAMVEFKIDQRDNTPMLMEINGRFWGSLQLAIDAGVDFPKLLVDVATEKVSPRDSRNFDYIYGVRTRWLWGDIDALLMLLLKPRRVLNLPQRHPGKIRTLLDFFKIHDRKTRFEVLSRSDIKPWLFETRQWFRKFI
jgi:predicted ATP-grasp superfamily ATP-dependent carboligase